MHRRNLLKLAAAASLGACTNSDRPELLKASNKRVVVVGAGIVGASIAYHLAKAGAKVTVIDKQGIASNASRGTFAWINASWAKQPQSYHQLNQQGVAMWRDLQSEIDLPIRWGGSIEWFSSSTRQEKLVEQIAEQQRWGEPARMIGVDELKLLEPQLHTGSATQFAFSQNDGAIDPVLATQNLLLAAKKLGAKIQAPCELIETIYENGHLRSVQTSMGSIPADHLVLATGAALRVPKKFAGIDVPQRSTPGVIAITKPMPRLINRVIAAPQYRNTRISAVVPGVHLHQREDGRIVLGEQDGAPNNEAHDMRLARRPKSFPNEFLSNQHASRMLGSAKHLLPGIEKAEVEEVHIGWRPLPLDGHPVLGRSPVYDDVSLAISHSGVTLAPIIGHLMAREVLSDVEIDELAAYRPSRKFKRIKRY